MNKTLSTMVDNIQNEVQDTSTAIESIIKAYINQRYFNILRQIDYRRIRTDYTFSTTAGTATYVMPDDFGKALNVRDSTNLNEIAQIPLQDMYEQYYETLDTRGTVSHIAFYDDNVMAQPTSASVITVVSSSASDTTQTVRIRGIVSSVETSEEVTLTGTTPALSTNSFSRVIGISKSAATTGKITATSNSAAVTVAVLPPQTTTGYFKMARLYYVPSAVITVAVPYMIKPMPLVEDEDYPLIDIADIIEAGAKADTWRYKRQFTKAAVFEAICVNLVADYVFDINNQPNQVTQLIPSMFNKDNLY